MAGAEATGAEMIGSLDFFPRNKKRTSRKRFFQTLKKIVSPSSIGSRNSSFSFYVFIKQFLAIESYFQLCKNFRMTVKLKLV